MLLVGDPRPHIDRSGFIDPIKGPQQEVRELDSGRTRIVPFASLSDPREPAPEDTVIFRGVPVVKLHGITYEWGPLLRPILRA